MNALVRIARMTAMEKTRDAVALQAAVLHLSAEHEVPASDRVRPVIERPLERPQHLVSQFRRHPLVGIEDENPVVRRAIDCVVLRRRRAEVLPLLDAHVKKLLPYALDRSQQCGESAALCVSDWGYIAALCDTCLRDRKNYLKLPGSDVAEAGAEAAGAPASI